MMPLRGRALWGAWLIALACHLGAGAEMSVVVVLGAGPDPQLALVGESVSAAVTATVADAPEPNAELQINGPVWAWSVGTPTVDGQPAAGATASVAGNGAAATVTLSSPVHGTVSVPVSVTCTYTAPATGQVWSASGGTSVSALFYRWVPGAEPEVEFTYVVNGVSYTELPELVCGDDVTVVAVFTDLDAVEPDCGIDPEEDDADWTAAEWVFEILDAETGEWVERGVQTGGSQFTATDIASTQYRVRISVPDAACWADDTASATGSVSISAAGICPASSPEPLDW